jgi:RimJ/RimL family protein N-acetyltransferase
MKNFGTKTLETNRLILRRFIIGDENDLINGYPNQENFQKWSNKASVTLEDEISFIKVMQEKYKDLTIYNWAIVLKENNKVIGSIKLDINEKNDSVEFSYVIDDNNTSKGYMTEALKEVERYSFEELYINRFQGACSILNEPSKRVMEKCGMTL